MNLHDHDLIYKAKNEGIKEGIKEGALQNKLENAQNAIKENIPLETVAKICNLSLDEVKKIKQDLEK